MLSNSNSTAAKYLKSLGFFKHIATPIDTIPESQVESNEEYRSKKYHGTTSLIYENDEDFRERIITTIKNNQIQSFRELMDEKDDFNIDSLGSTGWSLLHYASFHGYSDFVMELITKYKANVNLPNIDGWTPLHLCSYKGYQDIVIILLSKEDIDVNKNVPCIGTPLHCACKKNNTGVVSILLHKANFK
jgi:ankyrin repeat protein